MKDNTIKTNTAFIHEESPIQNNHAVSVFLSRFDVRDFNFSRSVHLEYRKNRCRRFILLSSAAAFFIICTFSGMKIYNNYSYQQIISSYTEMLHPVNQISTQEIIKTDFSDVLCSYNFLSETIDE